MEQLVEILNQYDIVVKILSIVGALIVGFFYPGIITYLTATRAELKLMHKDMRFFVRVFYILLITVVFPIIIAFYYSNTDTFFTKSGYAYFVLSSSIVYIILFFIFNKDRLHKLGNKRVARIFVKLYTGLYTFNLMLCFGLLLISSYKELTSLVPILAMLILTFLYYLLLIPPYRVVSNIYEDEVNVEILLSNGKTLDGMKLLHLTHNRMLILGDSIHQDKCTEIYSVILDNIVYIRFEIIRYEFGKEIGKRSIRHKKLDLFA